MSEFKTRDYCGQTFKIYNVRGHTIRVTSDNLLDGEITPHEPTGKFRASVMGCGEQKDKIENAFIAVFNLMIATENQRGLDALVKEMGDYYNHLVEHSSRG